MLVMVADFYEFNKKNDIHVLTENAGVKRKIDGASILDYEPSKKDLNNMNGKIVITSLIFAKDDYNRAHKIVCDLADAGVVALGVKTVYYGDLKEETLTYAKSKDMSIFLFGYSVYYENIVTDIHKMLRASKGRQQIEQKANSIVSLGVEIDKLREWAFSINSFFNERHIAVYLKAKKQATIKEDTEIIEEILKEKDIAVQDSIFSFRKGVLLIISSDDVVEAISQKPLSNTEKVLANFGFDIANHYIGISKVYNSLDLINVTMQQSLYAAKYCERQQVNAACYCDIGLYRIIFPLIESPWGRMYYGNIINKIKEYDKEHGTDLMETAQEYINTSGNIKKLSETTFQHENTIRYKIKKLKNLCAPKKVAGGDDFYTELHIAIMMDELLKNRF